MSLYLQLRPYFHAPPTDRLQILRVEALRLAANVQALAVLLDHYYTNLPENGQFDTIRRVIHISLIGAEQIQDLFSGEAFLLDDVTIDKLQVIRHELIMPITSITGSGRVLQLMADREPQQFPEAQQVLIAQLRQVGTDLRDVLDALLDPYERE